MAPGPTIDHLVSPVRRPQGITKDQLIAIAQENNRRKGVPPDTGLELFLPAPPPIKAYGSVVEMRREPGFRCYRPPELKQMKSLSLLSDPSLSYLDKIPATPSQRWTALGRCSTRQPSAAALTVEDVQEYEKKVTARIPATAKRLNQNCIFSKEINRIRASTMATVKINSMQRQQELSHVPALQPRTLVLPDQNNDDMLELRASLEEHLVDKLAAAEIETIKMIERNAGYPKMTSEQIKDKLGKLKTSAESHYSPLQSLRFMEVLRFPVRHRSKARQ